jgi:hypothetical protein
VDWHPCLGSMWSEFDSQVPDHFLVDKSLMVRYNFVVRTGEHVTLRNVETDTRATLNKDRIGFAGHLSQSRLEFDL